MLLDLALGDGDGLDVLTDIRRFSDVPLLVVSGAADEPTGVRALECGADDYVTKPFTHTELLARINAVLRRARTPDLARRSVVAGGSLRIDLEAGRVSVAGVEVRLSALEWRLLSFLAESDGAVVSAADLARNVWRMDRVESSTIKMCIRRLRQKLGDSTRQPRLICSHRRRGYSFELTRA